MLPISQQANESVVIQLLVAMNLWFSEAWSGRLSASYCASTEEHKK
jgi:hypothetical protein